MLRGLLRLSGKLREINARYRTPRLAMSRAVRVSLMVLRIYLVALVALMLYKFVTMVGS